MRLRNKLNQTPLATSILRRNCCGTTPLRPRCHRTLPNDCKNLSVQVRSRTGRGGVGFSTQEHERRRGCNYSSQTQRVRVKASSLFKSVSPMWGWFCLLQLIAGLSIVAFWIEWFTHPSVLLAERSLCAAAATGVFIFSNCVIFRSRKLGIMGSLAAWLMIACVLLPTA